MKEIIAISPVVSLQPDDLTLEAFLRLRTEKLLKELNQTSLEAEKKIVEITDVISRNGC